ncbi:MAG TPA: septum formation initiator family protein [Acidobacteriaceae bacterium]|jgi:cell division protein FtsB
MLKWAGVSVTLVPRSDQSKRLPVVRERAHNWKRRTATIAAGALALVMGYGVVFGHNGLTAFANKRQEARTLQAQTLQLQKENDRLSGHVNQLKNDPDTIEHQARESLHYARSGEVIVDVPAPPPQPAPASSDK